MRIIARILIILYDIILFDSTRQNKLKVKHKNKVSLPQNMFLGRYTDFDVDDDI